MDIQYKDREAFAAYCHRIQQNGLVYGSGGNVSVRVGDRFLITPSGRSLESLEPGEAVELSADGSYTGSLKPSSEFRMHLACYRARPDIVAIVHTHSVYAVAISCLRGADPDKAMPVYTPGYGKRVGALPMIPYFTPGSEPLAAEVSRIIGGRNSVLLKNHGVVAVGKTWEAALNLAEEIEENAQLTLLLGERGEELSAEQIAALAGYKTGS